MMKTVRNIAIAALFGLCCGCRWMSPAEPCTEAVAVPEEVVVAEEAHELWSEEAVEYTPVAPLSIWVEMLARNSAPPTPAPQPETVSDVPVPVPVTVLPPGVPEPASAAAPPPQVQKTVRDGLYALGVIGAVEPVYVLPFDLPLAARIDTGAATSSLDAQNIKLFERDGARWVSFEIRHRESGEVRQYKRRVIRRLRITRTNSFERRVSVMMPVRLGPELIQAEFTLNDRKDFDYPVLIGRNILAGLAVVDVNRKNTLK